VMATGSVPHVFHNSPKNVPVRRPFHQSRHVHDGLRAARKENAGIVVFAMEAVCVEVPRVVVRGNQYIAVVVSKTSDKAVQRATANLSPKAVWIFVVDGVVENIHVVIDAAVDPNWVLT
jgi:hypothetical protein